ncbi:MAG: hypothetical protein IJ166_04170 [Prevotella sp.]|nr:hypothetical protein [Prevotella sp.]
MKKQKAASATRLSDIFVSVAFFLGKDGRKDHRNKHKEMLKAQTAAVPRLSKMVIIIAIIDAIINSNDFFSSLFIPIMISIW